MKLYLLAIAAIVSSLGCISATGSDQVCKSSQLSSPLSGTVLPSGDTIPIPALSYSSVIDFSTEVSKFNDIASKLSIDVSSNTLTTSTANWAWVSHLMVSMQGQTAAFPQVQLVDFTPSSSDQPEKTVSVPLLVDGDTLLSYLSQGPITLTYSFMGDLPPTVPSFTDDLCVNASISIKKSL